MANNNDNSNDPGAAGGRPRRGSFTTQTLSNIFGRSNSISTAGGMSGSLTGSSPITTAAVQDHRRRMSISTLGLSGGSPTQPAPFPFSSHRTGSVSTDRSSESVDESAIDDDEGFSRSVPTTPFARRMSFGAQAMRARNAGSGSPGSNGKSSSNLKTSVTSALPMGPSGPRVEDGAQASQASTQSKTRTASDKPVSARPAEGSGFNWSEQLRSRAESSFSQTQRPNLFSTTPSAARPLHGRTSSIGDMPTPPTASPRSPPVAARPVSQKPDAFQERILKGDFYMD